MYTGLSIHCIQELTRLLSDFSYTNTCANNLHTNFGRKGTEETILESVTVTERKSTAVMPEASSQT